MTHSHSPVELMNLFWTHAGIYPGEGEISPYDFKERVESAARAGFKGMGIWHTDLQHTLQKYSLKEIKQMLDDNGMQHLELEFLTNWFIDGPQRRVSDNIKKLLFEASETLNAKHIKVGDFDKTPCPMSRLIDSFAALCEEAAAYGATIGFEFMPSSVIDNLPDSLTLVQGAGARNGGLILDIYHVMYQHIAREEMNKIPLEYLINLELNDGTFPGSALHEPGRERRFCGQGEFDIKEFIRWARDWGYTGPWAVEIFSRELLEKPLDEINRQAFHSTLEQFAGLFKIKEPKTIR